MVRIPSGSNTPESASLPAGKAAPALDLGTWDQGSEEWENVMEEEVLVLELALPITGM